MLYCRPCPYFYKSTNPFSFLWFASSSLALAAEVDHFSTYFHKLSDSTEKLNRVTNVWLQDSLRKLEAEGCDDEELLYETIGERFNSKRKSSWARELLSKNLDVINVEPEESVFKGLPFYTGFGLAIVKKMGSGPSEVLCWRGL